jgi:hypothetical protein
VTWHQPRRSAHPRRCARSTRPPRREGPAAVARRPRRPRPVSTTARRARRTALP